jgi:preprotein translocase subunit SecG
VKTSEVFDVVAVVVVIVIIVVVIAQKDTQEGHVIDVGCGGD